MWINPTICSRASLIPAMAVAGGVSAALLTTATVGSIFLTAGLFALPTLAAFAISVGVRSCISNNVVRYCIADLVDGVTLILAAAILIVTCVVFGILSPALILPFALTTGVMSLVFIGLSLGDLPKLIEHCSTVSSESNSGSGLDD